MRKVGRPQGSLTRRAIAFALWARAQPKPPTREQVREHLGCSGVQAAKWRAAFLDCLPAEPLQPAATGTTPTVSRSHQ